MLRITKALTAIPLMIIMSALMLICLLVISVLETIRSPFKCYREDIWGCEINIFDDPNNCGGWHGYE